MKMCYRWNRSVSYRRYKTIPLNRNSLTGPPLSANYQRWFIQEQELGELSVVFALGLHVHAQELSCAFSAFHDLFAARLRPASVNFPFT